MFDCLLWEFIGVLIAFAITSVNSLICDWYNFNALYYGNNIQVIIEIVKSWHSLRKFEEWGHCTLVSRLCEALGTASLLLIHSCPHCLMSRSPASSPVVLVSSQHIWGQPGGLLGQLTSKNLSWLALRSDSKWHRFSVICPNTMFPINYVIFSVQFSKIEPGETYAC